jgi:hypothetical protein
MHVFCIKPMNAQLPGPPESSVDVNALVVALADAMNRAESATDAHALPALTLQKVLGTNDNEMVQSLKQGALALKEGSLEGVEAILLNQAVTLNGVFHQQLQAVYSATLDLPIYEARMKLALRAQAQSAGTMEIIGNMKQGPKVLFAGQVNAAQQQVVNNGTAAQPAERIVRSAKNQNSSRARARVSPKSLNQSSFSKDNAMDNGSPRKATPADKELAAVESIDRPNNRRRQGKEQP